MAVPRLWFEDELVFVRYSRNKTSSFSSAGAGKDRRSICCCASAKTACNSSDSTLRPADLEGTHVHTGNSGTAS